MPDIAAWRLERVPRGPGSSRVSSPGDGRSGSIAGTHHEMVAMFADREVIRAEPFDQIELRIEQILSQLATRAGEQPAAYG